MARQITIEYEGGTVTGVLQGEAGSGVLLAHGAGTDQLHPSMVAIREGLARSDFAVLTFNYAYTERGGKRPDRQEKLLAVHRAAAEVLRPTVDDLFLAGRSMGGRMGTYLAAEGFPAAGLVLYAYPLHPPGKPEKLRVEQFADITVPMLFFQGTKDSLSRMDLFETHIAVLPNATVEILENAGHGFRGGGWNVESIVDRYVEGTSAWIRHISSGERSPQAS